MDAQRYRVVRNDGAFFSPNLNPDTGRLEVRFLPSHGLAYEYDTEEEANRVAAALAGMGHKVVVEQRQGGVSLPGAR